jgi:hypothetical protein
MTTLYFSREGSIPEVPWVMGDPKASYEWQVSVAGKGKKKRKGKRPKTEKLEDITVSITLSVKKRYFKKNIFSKFVEEDFDLKSTAEIMLRGFHHAKFSRITTISTDGESIYKEKYDEKPFKEIVGMLDEDEFKELFCEHVKISCEQKGNLRAQADIRKVHPEKNPPIFIRFFGKISKDNLNRLTSYLKKHLPVENIRY